MTHILEDLTHKMEGQPPENTGQMVSIGIYTNSTCMFHPMGWDPGSSGNRPRFKHSSFQLGTNALEDTLRSLQRLAGVFQEHRGTWMSQEVSKWLVNGL